MKQTWEWGLVLLRLLLGAVMILLGVEKLTDISGFRETLEATVFPSHFAYLLASFETLGGLLLITGFMIRATVLVVGGIKALSFFWAPYVESVILIGFEVPLLLLTLAIIILTKKDHKFEMQFT